ncbi:hypothetical protein EMPS_04433 [Entomortierella parvispora]|uniref:Uncharacterized protein n=1 Tax=Entomortierella parvispora TaxID=205924 RepID=A0A9P3H8M7_9FUNG|nr:hypothetical protein EMPS_04433 [Entomortierella parvispora]
MASTAGTGPKGSSTGFMSEYMSDLNQHQDINSFLQQNKQSYDPSLRTSTPSSSEPTPSTTPHSSESKSESTSEPSRKPFDSSSQAGSRPLPQGHTSQQKHAIQVAALDNCADLNAEMTDCLLGKAGTWWDRASMCMKAKEKFGKCCQLNKEALIEKGYAREGNTPEQDRAIMDYADDYTQKKMKEAEKK